MLAGNCTHSRALLPPHLRPTTSTPSQKALRALDDWLAEGTVENQNKAFFPTAAIPISERNTNNKPSFEKKSCLCYTIFNRALPFQKSTVRATQSLR